jgi:hypothetical protein
MGPGLQFDFRFNDIRETARPLIPGELFRHVLDVFRMNQFCMRTHIILLSVMIPGEPGGDTENGSELEDLADGGDHAVIDEILVTDDCFGDSFRKVLRSTVLGDEVVSDHPAIVLKAQFRCAEISGRGRDIVEKTAQVIYLGSILPIREMVSNDRLPCQIRIVQ